MHTLRQLHAELAGKLLDHKKEGERLTAAMKHVEAVMKLLQPGYDVRPIAVRRRKPNPWFKRGTILRAALDVLRAADKPLTAREVALGMVATRGIENPPAKTVASLTGSVNSSLQNYKAKGMVTSDGTMPARWSLAAG